MVLNQAPSKKRMYPGNSATRGRQNSVLTSIDAGITSASCASELRRCRRQLADISALLRNLEIPGISKGGVRPKKSPTRTAKASPPSGLETTPFSLPYVNLGNVQGAGLLLQPASRARTNSGSHSIIGGGSRGRRAQEGQTPSLKGAMPPPSNGRWALQLRIPAGGDPSETVRKLLGPGGSHVRGIAERHRAKLRVRGIGSGHAEGRRKIEAQVPLHLCISAANKRDLDGAVAEATALIGRATGTKDKQAAKRTTVRLALVNEGKPSDAGSFALCGWAHANGVDACLVSEGALAGRSLVTDHGFTWQAPLKQVKGGAGFLVSKESATTGGKIRLVQCPELRWSLASWRTPGGTGLISAYINPVDVQDSGILTSFLTRLSELIRDSHMWIIGGDFNAPNGSSQRRALDSWSEVNGFTVANPGVLTHFAGGEHRGSDLDLVLVRGATVQMLATHDPVTRGHVRQIFELVEERAPKGPPAPLPFAWKRLSCPKVQEKFTAAVRAAVSIAPSLEAALEASAAAILGRVTGPAQASCPLPPSVKKEVVKLRKEAKRHPRGSPEYQDVSRKIGLIVRKHKQAQWRLTLTKLASSSVVEENSWSLLRFLQKSSPTTRMVGIPDVEIRDYFQTIYQSNDVRRSDWVFSTEEGRGASVGGSVPELDAPFTSAEVTAALNALPNRKAPGLDGLPHEAYKALSRDPSLTELMASQASALIAGGEVPSLEGRLVTIPKRGPSESAAEMRPLMMLPTSRKLVEKLVAFRLERLAAMRGWDGLHHLQGGFRHGLGVERQLVLAHVAVLDAVARGQRRRFVGLDLIKAFDRIPKEFAAHCAAGYLRSFCPKLADLVARLALAPFEAQVGGHTFAVSTGVPQGGVLSPWLFVMAMNDLTLRLGGAGGTVVGEQEVGTLLFADDILLVDDSLESSDSRCRLTKEWVEEWGGAINPKKTQWLDINATSSPSPGVQEGLGQGGAIDFLGVVLTPKGVKPKVGPEAFTDMLTAVRSTMDIRGLAPAPALQTLRSVAWAKIAHGAVVTLPCAAALTNKWLAAARQVLGTFKQVHRAEMVRELGLLYHPVAWLCRAVVRFYGTALTTAKDPVLKRVLTETVASPDHSLRRGIEATLKPCGVTWDELASVPTSDLLRKADGRLREWSREQLLAEAERLQLHRGDDAPLWREWSDGPRKYLYEVNARYGFMFRRGSFAPTDLETAACYFCGHLGGDRGRHLLHCEVAGEEVPLPEELRSLPAPSLQQALLLEDATPVKRLRAVLEYMQQLYQARMARRNRSPQAEVRRHHVSNRDFFKSLEPRPAVGSSAPGRGAASRRARSISGWDGEDGERVIKRRRSLGAQPETPPASIPEADELDEISTAGALILLDEPCHEMTLSPRSFPSATEDRPNAAPPKRSRPEGVSNLPVPKRSHLSILEDNGSSTPLATPLLPSSPQQREGAWTEEEIHQLARAALRLGERSAASLAPHVPTRGVRQIRMRMRTADFRRSVDRLRAAQDESVQQVTRELPATVQPIPAPEQTHPVPLPSGLASLRPAPNAMTAEKQFGRGRWTKREISLLHGAIQVHGGDVTGEILSKAVGTRSSLQCLDRMREKTTKEFIVSLSLPMQQAGASSTVTSGRWDLPEIRRLERAINDVGSCVQYAELAATMGNRTQSQVSVKINDLLRAGKLRQTGPSSFQITM